MVLKTGDDRYQKKISLLEQKEVIEPALLEQVASVLKLPAAAIENFDEEAAVNIIANTFHDEATAYSQNYKCKFNPIDKIVEFYEALVQSEKEKVALLQQMLGKMK